MTVKGKILYVIVLASTVCIIAIAAIRRHQIIAVIPGDKYSVEFLTPETVRVTGYPYRAMKELREKYVIKNIEPIYGNPKRRFTATEYIITIKPKSPQ